MRIRDFLESLDGAGLVITNWTELEDELYYQGYDLDREMSIEPESLEEEE